MGGCCPGAGGTIIMQAKQELDGVGGNGNMNIQIDPGVETVRMEYFGPRVGAVTFHGKRKKYRFGNNAVDRYNDVNPEDVEMFLGQPHFEVVDRDAHKIQVPADGYIPEPSGEVVQETVQETIQEVAPESDLSGDGEPPALDIEPMPNTVKEIKSAVMGADLDTLLSWLREEQNGKARKTALEAIDGALEDRYA